MVLESGGYSADDVVKVKKREQPVIFRPMRETEEVLGKAGVGEYGKSVLPEHPGAVLREKMASIGRKAISFKPRLPQREDELVGLSRTERLAYAQQERELAVKERRTQLAERSLKQSATYTKLMAKQAERGRQMRLAELRQRQLERVARRQQVMPEAMQTIQKTRFEQQAEERTQPQGREYGQFFQPSSVPSIVSERGEGEGVGERLGALLQGGAGGGNPFEGVLGKSSQEGSPFGDILRGQQQVVPVRGRVAPKRSPFGGFLGQSPRKIIVLGSFCSRRKADLI